MNTSFLPKILALSALVLGLASPAQAQTFTPGDVFWSTSLAQISPPVSSQIRVVQITASGDYASAPAFAVLPDRVYGQIAFTNNRTTAYIPSFFLNRVLTISPSGVVGDGSPGHPIFATGINRPTGLLVVRTGALAGHLLCSSFGQDRILDITAGGDFTGAPSLATGTPSARNIVQLFDGTLLVATSNGVRNITAGGASTSFASGFSGRDIIQTTSGTIYVTTSTGTVLDVTAGGNLSAAVPFASGQVFVGLAINSNGRLLASVSDDVAHKSMLFDITAGGDFSAATPFATNLPGESETCLDTVPGDALLVTTDPATGVTGTHATLHGTINPGNLPTSGYFEYGTSPTLAGATTTAPPVNIPAGGSAVPYSTGLTGLAPFTTYYFRAVGTNIQYTVKGDILSFATGSPNNPPEPQDDNIHPPAGLGAYTVNVLGNDSDPDMEALTVVDATGGTFGTPTVTPGGGSVTYTPGPGYTGNDAFSYTVSDGAGGMASANVTLHNAAPVAHDDLALLTGGSVTIDVLANDTDADAGDDAAFAVIAVTDGAHGTVTNNGTDVTYNVVSPFLGTDTFTYTMTDGRGTTATATVTVQTIVGICNFTGATVPGAPAGSTFKSFGLPSVVDGGIQAYKVSIKTPAGTRNVIVAGNPPAVVVTKGDAAPGLSGVTLGTFKDPVLNNLGNIAFISSLSGSVDSTNNGALTTNLGGALTIVARKGQEMPGGPTGNTFSAFKSVAITDTAVFFAGQLTVGPGSVTSANDFGLWVWHPGSGLESIVQESDVVGGKQVKTITVLASVSGSQGQGRSTHGDLALMRLTFTDSTQAIYKMTASLDLPFAAAGDTLTSGVAGAKWTKFGVPGLNTNGATTFLGTLASGTGGVSSANNIGVFAGNDAASLSLFARKGQDAPDIAGTKFASFKDPLLNANGSVAFLAGIAGGTMPSMAKKGLWTSDDLGFHLLARGGDQPPGTPAGVQWSSFVGAVLPDGLGPVFTAKLVLNVGGVDKTNSFGVWGRDGFGALFLLTRTGDQLFVNGSLRTIRTIYALKAASGSPGQGRAYSHDGTVIYKVKFVDGTEAILCATLPTNAPL